MKKQRETTYQGRTKKLFEENEKEMGKLKNGLTNIIYQCLNEKKGNKQTITREGKKDLTKKNCKIKNG